MPISTTSIAMIVLAIGLGFGAHAMRNHPRRLWAGAWAGLLAGSFLNDSGWTSGGAHLFLAMLFPTGQLMGALAFARGRVPVWVAPLGLGAAVAIAQLFSLAPRSPFLDLFWALNTVVLFSAALIVRRADSARVHGRRDTMILPLLLLMISVLSAVSWALASWPKGITFPVEAVWLLVLMLAFPIELRMEDRSRLAESKRLQAHMQARLAEAQQRFQLLAENSIDLVAELGDLHLETPIVTYANPRFRDLLGWEPAELEGKPVSEFLHVTDAAAAGAFYARVLAEGDSSWKSVRGLHSDGHYVWLDAEIRGFVNQKGERRWVLNARDAEQRRRDEQRLKNEAGAQRQARESSEARFRALADQAPDLISEFDEGRAYVFANQAFQELLGIEPAELIGKPADLLIHRDDLPGSRDGMENAIDSEGRTAALHRLSHADGTWRWFDNTGRAYRTASGELRFVSIGRDVTELLRIESERQQLFERVQQAQRAESLRILAGGVAHDFNNLLTVILGNVGLLQEEPTSDSERTHCVERIRTAADHGSALTNQLLAYTASSSHSARPLALGQVVRDTTDMLRVSMGAGNSLIVECEDDVPAVMGNETELRQLLLNLVTNASEALGQRSGTIRVRTMAATSATADTAERWAVLEVVDDGPGMDDETYKRATEPFFTTKASGHGLGLAAVHGIVTAHEGFLSAESALGKGCTFRAWFPPTDQPLEPERDAPRATLQPATGRLLVVDDDEAVRELHVLFLERAGFEVQSAPDGASALRAIEASPDLDAVVLDLKMEGIPGAEVLRKISPLRPALPVVLLTGFPGELAKQEIAGAHFHALLQKPCDPDVLVEAVQKAIASRG